MRIVILGAPGSGKKTQTGLLADHYHLKVLTASELVKQALAEEGERGDLLRLQQQAGQPITDDQVLGFLQQRLAQSDLDNGFILDGFPRNLLQALTLDEVLNEMGIQLDFVLIFEIETDALMERLVGRRTCRSCGAVYNIYTYPTAVEDVCDLCGGRLHQRADDTEETVSSRLHVFDHLTVPLLGHYGKQGKVLRVDGEGEVEAVFSRACEAIERFLAERPAVPAPTAGSAGDAAESGSKPVEVEKPATRSKAGSGRKQPVKTAATPAKPKLPAKQASPVPVPAKSKSMAKTAIRETARAAAKPNQASQTAKKKAARVENALATANKVAKKAVAATSPKASVKQKQAAKKAPAKKLLAKKAPAAAQKAPASKAPVKKATLAKVAHKRKPARPATQQKPVSKKAAVVKKAVKAPVKPAAKQKPAVRPKTPKPVPSATKAASSKKPVVKKAVAKKGPGKVAAKKTPAKKGAKPSSSRR